MKWVIIVVIVLAVLLLAGLIAASTKRKKQEVARERAGEIRHEATVSDTTRREQEAQARATAAEAERARAEADQLEARAQQDRTAYDQTLAHQEDRIREADRLDPDVDHRDPGYSPGLADGGTHHETRTDGPHTGETRTGGAHASEARTDGAHTEVHRESATGPEGPGPVDPRTGEPLDTRDPRTPGGSGERL